MTQGLIRPKAIKNSETRLHGEILVQPKVSTIATAAVLLIWCTLTLLWLTNSEFSRKEVVRGWLTPSDGVIRQYAYRTGVVSEVLVEDGDKVVKGQPLILVESVNFTRDGYNVESFQLNELTSHQALLLGQLKNTKSTYSAKENDLKFQVVSLQNQIRILQSQKESLKTEQTLTDSRIRRYQSMNDKGYISLEEIERLKSQSLSLQRELQNVDRDIISQNTSLQELRTALESLPKERANSISEIKARQSDLARQLIDIKAQQSHIIKAPISGTIHNLQVHRGQYLTLTSGPILTILPENTNLQFKLILPIRAAGRVAPGQNLSIRFDAFPYQVFGLHPGKIEGLSSTVLLENELNKSPIPLDAPSYIVTGSIASQSIHAYGKDIALKSGMTFSADIETDRRSIFQWILDPIYSIQGKL